MWGPQGMGAHGGCGAHGDVGPSSDGGWGPGGVQAMWGPRGACATCKGSTSECGTGSGRTTGDCPSWGVHWRTLLLRRCGEGRGQKGGGMGTAAPDRRQKAWCRGSNRGEAGGGTSPPGLRTLRGALLRRQTRSFRTRAREALGRTQTCSRAEGGLGVRTAENRLRRLLQRRPRTAAARSLRLMGC